MEGLAKTAEISKPVAVANQDPVNLTYSRSSEYDGIPMGVFMLYDKRFGGEDSDTMRQLKAVTDYAKANTDGDIGNMMLKLRELDIRFGQPKIGESRLTKAFNYIKMTSMIESLQKQRQAITGA